MTPQHEMLQPRCPHRCNDSLAVGGGCPLARVAGQVRRGTNTRLAGLAPFSVDIRSAIMPDGMELPAFTKFTDKTDPEEHIEEFQSQMCFHQPDSRVYCRAFPTSLAGPTLKWFNRLLEGWITSFKELKNRFTRTAGPMWKGSGRTRTSTP
ncbi:hypothetical protein LIER_27937 [Lithospermum erythrorhizon]|uniref:Retrotransposon gag domain-containing protein n=1 Tax=Lithospermum erythrorhizon TaxID=34254 RepID=A0AAV3RFD8_LITER